MKDQVADGEEQGENELAYLKMPGWKYYTLTLLLYLGCILGAIFITNIAVVFEFVGAFGLSIMSFTIPGLMYLLILRNEKALTELESDRQRFWNSIGSYLVIALSVVNMILVVVKQIFPSDTTTE